MNHNDIRHKLSDYLDGVVTAKEKTEIEEHLKACSKCSDALGELRKTIEQVKQVEAVEPPAWMTQKIMAKVREEAERRTGIWNKLLFPLRMRPAISAVAVLFLAVTAFYIYQNIRPEMKFAEAPLQTFEAKKEKPSADTMQDKVGRVEEYRQQPKQAPQEPGYKALDMKLEYEKPAPPVPKEQASEPAPAAAPAPAKPAEQPLLTKKESTVERRTVAPQAAVAAKIQEQAALSADTAHQPETTEKGHQTDKSLNIAQESEQSTPDQLVFSENKQYPVPDKYVHLITDKGKELVETWFFPGGEFSPGEMYFYNNGLLIVDSYKFSKSKEKRYFIYDYVFSLEEEKKLLTITFIDKRIDFNKMAQVEKWHLDHNPPDLVPTTAIDVSKKSITYKVKSHRNYKKGIFFLGDLFADLKKK